MTWLLVSTSPLELITIPVPAASSLLYCSVVLMITTPGFTLVTMACSPPARGAAEPAGEGTASPPGKAMLALAALAGAIQMEPELLDGPCQGLRQARRAAPGVIVLRQWHAVAHVRRSRPPKRPGGARCGRGRRPASGRPGHGPGRWPG